MTPVWDPNFTSPPCGQLAAPYLYAHGRSRPNLKLCTHISVLGLSCEPLALPWLGGPPVGMTPDWMILAS